MPFSLQFRLSFLFSPPQSSCQPATSSGAATAASWRETAPSVSVLTALRSARTGRAAEVGFSCTSWEQWGGGGAGSCHGALLPTSPFALSQTSIRWISRRCWVYENHLSAGRASCTVHYMQIQDTVCLWLVLSVFPLLGCIYSSIVLLQLQFWGTWTSLEYFHLPLYYSLAVKVSNKCIGVKSWVFASRYYAECIRAEEPHV